MLLLLLLSTMLLSSKEASDIACATGNVFLVMSTS